MENIFIPRQISARMILFKILISWAFVASVHGFQVARSLVRVTLHRHFLKMVSALAAWHPHTTIIPAKCTDNRVKTQAAQTGEPLYREP